MPVCPKNGKKVSPPMPLLPEKHIFPQNWGEGICPSEPQSPAPMHTSKMCRSDLCPKLILVRENILAVLWQDNYQGKGFVPWQDICPDLSFCSAATDHTLKYIFAFTQVVDLMRKSKECIMMPFHKMRCIPLEFQS